MLLNLLKSSTIALQKTLITISYNLEKKFFGQRRHQREESSSDPVEGGILLVASDRPQARRSVVAFLRNKHILEREKTRNLKKYEHREH